MAWQCGVGPAAALPAGATALWGDTPLDMYRRPAVRDDTFGGYPVVTKWPRYREGGPLGRLLLPDEAAAVTGRMQRRAALLRLAPALEANDAATVGVGHSNLEPRTTNHVAPGGAAVRSGPRGSLHAR